MSLPAYGEFIRTYTDGGPSPDVLPGGSLTFPTATVNSVRVDYVEEVGRVGLLVPRGVYLVSWALNPGVGASVNLLVNGTSPAAGGFPYTNSFTTSDGLSLNVEFLVKASRKRDNLISLVNGGSDTFTLNEIPDSRIGTTSIITHIRVQRLDDLA